jgi:urease accessory protein
LLQGLLHPFHGLDHVLAAVAVGVWGARLGGKAVWALPVAFVVALLGGTALGIAGWGLPMVEVRSRSRSSRSVR